jgi:hypothetical protein
MANAAIAYTNLADAATLTASSQALTMPAANVQSAHVGRRWRSLSATSEILTFQWSSDQTIDTLAVFGTTMTAAGTVQFTLKDSLANVLDSSSALVVDSNFDSNIRLLGAPITNVRFLVITFSDPSASYIEAGRVFAGARSSFGTNFSYGWQYGWTDRSIRSKTRGGQTLIFRDNSFRTLDVSFNFLTSDERNGFVESIDRVNLASTDVLFITDTASANLPRDSIWGLITDQSPVVQPYFDRFAKKYSIEERL